MRERPPSENTITIASVIAVANALWTALVLGGAVAYGARCPDDYRPNEQSCDVNAVALGVLWFVGQLVLTVPTGWAAHVLIWADRERPPSPSVRVGLLGIAATLAIPVGLIILGLVGV